MHGPHFPGGNRFFELLGWITQAIGQVVLALVVLGVLVLLVRFLIIATRAAQLYVSAHEGAKPAAYAPVQTPAGPTSETPTGSESTATPDAAAPASSPTPDSATPADPDVTAVLPPVRPTPPAKPRTPRARTPKTPPSPDA